jgi:hypothetical protein
MFSRNVPEIVAATEFGHIGNMCPPRYRGGKYVAFVLPEMKATNLIFCVSAVNHLDPFWDFGFV